MSAPQPASADRARVVFEPGGYARFAGTAVAPRQRFVSLVRLFVADLWRSTRAKLATMASAGPALVCAAIVLVCARWPQLATNAGQQASFAMQLLGWNLTFSAAWLLLLHAGQVAPLIARDAHQGALLLYFSRPVLPAQYLWARLTAVTLKATIELAAPALALIALMALQYGGHPVGCPWPSWAGPLWWVAVAAAAVVAAAVMAAMASLVALAAGVVVRTPSAPPLAFGGLLLASNAVSWVLQASWGRDSAARALDLHHALQSPWRLLTWLLEPDRPPVPLLQAAGGGLLIWMTLCAIAWWALTRFLAHPPLGKGRA